MKDISRWETEKKMKQKKKTNHISMSQIPPIKINWVTNY